MSDTPLSSDRPHAAIILALTGLAVLAAGLYTARKVIAREVLIGWLRDHGAAAEAQVDRLGFGSLSGQILVGRRGAPDLLVADAAVDYGLGWRGFEVRTIRLSRPVLRAGLHAGRLTFGALDPLITYFTHRPPQPDRAQPRVEIDQGLVLLSTDAGDLRIAVQAAAEEGRLAALYASTAPARLAGGGIEAELPRAALRLRTRGKQVDVVLDLAASRLAGKTLALDGVNLRLALQAPYPDLQKRRADGAVALHAEFAAARVAGVGHAMSDARAVGDFKGQAAGDVSDLRLRGAGQAMLDAHRVRLSGTEARALRLTASAADLRWSRRGGDAVAATPQLAALLQDFAAGDLRLAQVSSAFSGPVAWRRAGGLELSLGGRAAGRGAWGGLGRPQAGDGASLVALKRAAADFRVAAPALSVGYGARGLLVSAAEPIRLKAGGGEVVLRPAAGAPLVGPDGGAFRLASAGALPKLAAEVADLRLTAAGAEAQAAIRGEVSAGVAQDATFDVAGRLRVGEQGMGFRATRCAEVTARRLVFGPQEVTGLAGRLCRAELAAGRGGWRLRGDAEDVAAALPVLQARASSGQGPVSFGGEAGRLSGRATIAEARLADAAPQTRFNPLRVQGAASLANGLWTASLAARTPAGQQVGKAALRHQIASGDGVLSFDTGALRFTPDGLQPAQLSPLAGVIGSPAEGAVRFAGRFAWTPAGVASGGSLEIPRLDFQTPAGRVTGLAGTVDFSSLAPLRAAPGQLLTAERVEAVVPVTGLSARLGVEDQALTLAGGEAQAAGGRVRLETLSLPLTAQGPTRGVVELEGVQLHDLVEASPFGPRVDLDAEVSGRLPFSVEQGRVRIAGGNLHAIAPGRLSISRAALTAVSAQGQVAAAEPAVAQAAASTDTFTDFAYQALENLAFEKLDAAVESRPNGRLAVLFQIQGRHDPPQRQEIRLSLFDLVGRRFLGRQLPLPSGTKVNLTLDTTLNLDDLLADYADYQRLRSSRGVQP